MTFANARQRTEDPPDIVAAAERFTESVKRALADPTPKNVAARVIAFEELKRAQAASNTAPASAASPLERLRTLDGITLAELRRIEIPEPRWIVEGYAEEQSFGVMFGAPGAGKTLLAARTAAAAIARGRKVKFIEAEGGVSACRKRVDRAVMAEPDANPELIKVVWNPPLSLSIVEDVDRLTAACDGFDLVFLDSMAAFSGGISENDSDQWGHVSNQLAEVRAQTGSAIWPLHHSIKAGWRKGVVPELSHLRGSGALAGRADRALALVSGDCTDTIVEFEVHDLKAREAGKAKPRLCTVRMDGCAADFTEGDVPENGNGKRRETAEELLERILLVLKPDQGTPQHTLRKMMGVSLERLGEALSLGRRQKPPKVVQLSTGSALGS